MKVLKIQAYRDSSKLPVDVYIQKVTEKSIVVIQNDIQTIAYDRKLGKPRGHTNLTLSISQLEKFMTWNRLSTWNGGWLPRVNSKGIEVHPEVGRLHSQGYQKWFKHQGVEVLDLVPSNKD